MKRILILLAMVVASACSKPTGSAEPVLVLEDAKISGEIDGTTIELAVASDGKVTIDGKQVATLKSTGELIFEGKVAVKIARDGRLTDGDGKSDKNTSIRADGALLDGTEVLVELTADGKFRGPMVDTEMRLMQNLTVTGSPKGRRALMLAWFGVQSAMRRQPPPAP